MNRTIDDGQRDRAASYLSDSGEAWMVGYPPPDPAASLQLQAPAEPRRSWRKASLQGVARNVQLRSETFGKGASRQILTFRLERYDAAGNRLMPVPVALRTGSIMGQLNEGEHVLVTGRWQGGMLRVRRIRNLSTGSYIATPPTYRWLKPVAVLAVIAIIVGSVIWAVAAFRDANENLDLIEGMTPAPNGAPPLTISDGGSGGGEPDTGEAGELPELTTAPAPTTTAAPSPPPPPASVTLEVFDHGFAPSPVRLRSGDTLVIAGAATNSETHTFTLMPAGLIVDVAPSTLQEHRIDLPPGDYNFHCDRHGTSHGMAGTLTVGG